MARNGILTGERRRLMLVSLEMVLTAAQSPDGVQAS